eukprot:scaffold17108_cov139-Isochrysis_galbana.AAC.4
MSQRASQHQGCHAAPNTTIHTNLRCCVGSACHAARLLLRPNDGLSPPPPVKSCRHELTDFVNQLAKVGMPIRHVN